MGEKNEMLMYVSRRTNEASLQSKAKLDELKASLDEKMNLFKDTSSMVEKLEQEVSVQEEFLKGELERVNREEKKKIENAVEPVLRNYEDRRSKEVEKQWQEELTNANKILSLKTKLIDHLNSQCFQNNQRTEICCQFSTIR